MSHCEDFFEFHKKNPKVFGLFSRFAIEAAASGRTHFGAKAIMERVRWEVDINTVGENHDFKLNNNHTAYYARLFMKAYPEYKDFFRTRVVSMAANTLSHNRKQA